MKKHPFFWFMIVLLLGVAIGAFLVRDTLILNAQITYYTNQLSRDPNNFTAALNLGKFYFRSDDYTRAAEYYKRAVEINAASAEAYNNLGNTYRKLLKYEDAERAYRDAIGLAPNYITSYTNLVALYKNWPAGSDDKTAAIDQLFVEAIAANPDRAVLVREAISYYKSVGNTAKMEEYQKKLEGN